MTAPSSRPVKSTTIPDAKNHSSGSLSIVGAGAPSIVEL
jgi:hypothetical protein